MNMEKENMVVEEGAVKTAPKSSKKKEVERQKAKTIDLHELIPVRNVTSSGLTYVSSKTGLLVSWENYDDIEYIEFGELRTMKTSQPKFMNEPFLIVEDEDAVEALGLTKLYKQLEEIADLEGFFGRRLEDMQQVLMKLPKGSKKLIQDKARELVTEGTLYDIRKIKMLEQELSIDLQILID